MSEFTPGARILASWLGGPWQPATVLETNPVSGLVRVRFDHGQEAWLSSVHTRAAPLQTPSPSPSESTVAPSPNPSGTPPATPSVSPLSTEGNVSPDPTKTPSG